jgi:hypothetical protein
MPYMSSQETQVSPSYNVEGVIRTHFIDVMELNRNVSTVREGTKMDALTMWSYAGVDRGGRTSRNRNLQMEGDVRGPWRMIRGIGLLIDTVLTSLRDLWFC